MRESPLEPDRLLDDELPLTFSGSLDLATETLSLDEWVALVSSGADGKEEVKLSTGQQVSGSRSWITWWRGVRGSIDQLMSDWVEHKLQMGAVA